MSHIPPRSAPSRRRRWLVWGGLAVTVLAPASGVYWAIFLRGWTVGTVERLVRAEVPLGSTRQAVEAWLDRHNFSHEYYADVTLDRVDGQTPPRQAGLSERDLGGLVRGIVSDANVDPVYEGWISIYFFFDHEGKLAGYLVHPFVPEPRRNRWLR